MAGRLVQGRIGGIDWLEEGFLVLEWAVGGGTGGGLV